MFELPKGVGPVYRGVVEAVRKGIAEGELRPGQKLPPHVAMARRLGVHQTTVRHAYDILGRQGLVVSRRGSGTYVHQDASRRLDGHKGPFSVTLVVGQPDLADCTRDAVRIVTEFQAGLAEVMGPQIGRLRYAPSFERESLGALPDRSAVLIKVAPKCDPSLLLELEQRRIPVLAFSGETVDLQVPRVDYDHSQAAAIATQYLIDCGYRRLGFIGSMGQSSLLGVKFFEFTNVLYKAGQDFQVRHVADVSYAPGEGYAAVRRMTEAGDLPEAFVADNDFRAMEVILALRHAGLKVPEDIGVVGYDDIPEAATFDPPLTTVRTPRREMGRRVARMLLNWPEDGTKPADVVVEAEMVVRNTTRTLDPSNDDAADPSGGLKRSASR